MRSAAVGGVLAWLVNTAASAVIGLVVGAIVVAVAQCCPSTSREALITNDLHQAWIPRLRWQEAGWPATGLDEATSFRTKRVPQLRREFTRKFQLRGCRHT